MDSRLLLSSNARELPTAGTRCALAKHTLVMLKKIAKQKLRSPFWSVLEVLTPLIFVTLVVRPGRIEDAAGSPLIPLTLTFPPPRPSLPTTVDNHLERQRSDHYRCLGATPA